MYRKNYKKINYLNHVKGRDTASRCINILSQVAKTIPKYYICLTTNRKSKIIKQTT